MVLDKPGPERLLGLVHLPTSRKQEMAHFFQLSARVPWGLRFAILIDRDRDKNKDDRFHSSGKVQSDQRDIDQLDADEWRDDTAETVDDQIPNQNLSGAHRAIFHAGERERDECDNDQSIKDDGTEDRASRRMQMHNVERGQRTGLGPGQEIKPTEHRWQDCEVLRDVVRNAESR
jgi:hypothetical protein